MPKLIGQIAKAIVAGVLAALSVLAGYLVNNTSFSQVTAGQWVAVVIAGLIAGGAVYGIPNAKPPAK